MLKAKAKTIGISFPANLLDAIEKIRGNVPRSTFVCNILAERLTIKDVSKAKKKEKAVILA